MEYAYPYSQPPELSWWSISLHALLLCLALLPIVGLFRQSRRPARTSDAWLWIGCLLVFPVLLLIAAQAFSEHSLPFLIGLFAFSEVVAAVAVLITIFRLWRQGNAVSAATVLGGLIGLTLLVVMLLPAVPSAREAARRMQCGNNLKQIILGIHNYHDEYDFLPSAVSTASNEVETSWRVFLLPYLELASLFEQYDQSQVWDGEANSRVSRQKPMGLTCPSNPVEKDDLDRYYTAYAMPLGPSTAFSRSETRSLPSSATGSTIAVVEACGRNIVWTNPRDVDVSVIPMGVNRPGLAETMSEGVLSSTHPGGAQAANLDGSVQFIPEHIDPEVLRQLLSPFGPVVDLP
jgi:hypothetical protein